MRSIFIITIILFLFTACAAQPAALTAGVTTTIAPTSTLVPTETPTASATLTPESLLPQEVKDKFETAGIDLKDLTKDGLPITLESGEVVLLTNEELEKGIYSGQDNVLQYRDASNQNVIYAFDKETKTFLEASKYIQKDKTDPEKYIQVANWDELFALWAKEKIFLIPFDPENTYFPPLDKINRDYADRSNRKLGSEFDFSSPFGVFPAGMDSPFRFVNFTRLQKDASDGRSLDSYIISEQVFNPDDGSLSVLHFYEGESKVDLQIVLEQTEDGKFLLPRFSIRGLGVIGNPPDLVLLKYLKENNLLVNDDQMPLIEELVYEWFETGHVPQELENIPTWYKGNYTK